MKFKKKNLADLIDTLKAENIKGELNRAIKGLAIDSRKANKDFLFIAKKGYYQDGHEYVDEAISRGAIAIVYESVLKKYNKNVTYIQVTNSNKAAGKLAQTFFENSSRQFTLIGITGTNGKSSIAHILFNLLSSYDIKVGLFSTIENRIGDKTYKSDLTTPDSISINQMMYKMVEARCEYVIMEVSSHAIDQDRIEGLDFDVAVFTNLSHDHVEYHGGYNNYRDVKKSWFDNLPTKVISLINADDKNGTYMVQSTKSKIKYYGLRTLTDYKVKIIDNGIEGLYLKINGSEFYSRLRGSFNAYNLCAAFGVGSELDFEQISLLERLSLINTVSGRFEVIYDEKKSIWGVIDYAHTPDALENILSNVDKIKKKGSRLLAVLGCGGDRDKEKRPIMAKIACNWSDESIFTSDNPRSENPKEIINDMIAGLNKKELEKVIKIIDRREAIHTAINMAKKNDVIVIAGKGHEDYQEIKGKKYPFDDLVIMKKAFQL